MSSDFVDGKLALSQGRHLELASRAILELAEGCGVEFDAVGGLTMGADIFSYGVALTGDRRWFVVRKQPKGRGTNRRCEGTPLTTDDRVLLVEDVITTGGSILDALDAVRDTGAEVVLAASLELAEPGEPVSAPELIERFDPDAVPPAPWMYVPLTPGGSGFA